MNKRKDFYSKAQAMMEYLLVMVVVVVIVFVAFRKSGSLIEKTNQKTKEYFDTGTTAIMGGYYNGTDFVPLNPNRINGGWCAWSACTAGYESRECACPRPAFGGAPCADDPDGAVRAADCGGACWQGTVILGSVVVWAGDDVSSATGCSIKHVDNPEYLTEAFPGCPDGCDSRYVKLSSKTGSGETGCTGNINWLGCNGDWVSRTQWICYNEESKQLCVGDTCTVNGATGTYDTDKKCSVPSSGGGGGGGCFAAGTQILMADGTLKAVEDVAVGDFLKAGRDSAEPNEVKRKYMIAFDGWLYSINGSNKFVTESHPFMTADGWKSFNPEATKKETPELPVTPLAEGDVLLTKDGSVTLERFDRVMAKTTVYNMDVISHDFYADGYLVHNVLMDDMRMCIKNVAPEEKAAL